MAMGDFPKPYRQQFSNGYSQQWKPLLTWDQSQLQWSRDGKGVPQFDQQWSSWEQMQGRKPGPGYPQLPPDTRTPEEREVDELLDALSR